MAPQTGLTDDQQRRLQAVMEQLEKLEVPELLLESARLRMPKPMTEEHKPRFRANFAGAIAAQKVLAYLDELHRANDLRIKLGREIARIKQEARELERTDPERARAYLTTAGRFAGMQEVAIHRFASAIERISEFLPIAMKTAGHKLSAADNTLLRNYVNLRNYYEHLENRFPGGTHDAEACVESDHDGFWQVIMELPINKHDGMIEIQDSRIDVSTDAAMDVTVVIQRAWGDLKSHALAEVQKHFLSHPDAIPEPGEVRDKILADLGGVVPYWERQEKEAP